MVRNGHFFEAQRLFDELAQHIQSSSVEYSVIYFCTTPLWTYVRRDKLAGEREYLLHLLRSGSILSAAPHFNDPDDPEEELVRITASLDD